MLHKNLIDIMTRFGLNRDGNAWNVPDGQQATIYLSLDEESLIIDRVHRLDVESEYAVVTTHRRERYAVELDGIRAIRLFQA